MFTAKNAASALAWLAVIDVFLTIVFKILLMVMTIVGITDPVAAAHTAAAVSVWLPLLQIVPGRL